MFMFPTEYEVQPRYPSRWITYTPERAAKILKEQNAGNRRPKKKKIETMARAMKAGKFYPTHQGIAFADDGTLLDGQCRLMAIVLSGVTFSFLTTYGMTRRDQAEMDTGSARTLTDSLKFGLGRDVDSKVVATINAMVGMGLHVGLLPDEVEEYLLAHWDAIEFAIKQSPERAAAGVRAVVARAYATVDHAELREFCRIMGGGHFAPGEEAANVLGRMIEANRVKPREWFAYANRALLCYVRRRTVKMLKPLEGIFFPLDNEKAQGLPPEFLQDAPTAEPAAVVEEHEFAGV